MICTRGLRLEHLDMAETHAADADDPDVDAVIGAEDARGGQRGRAQKIAA